MSTSSKIYNSKEDIDTDKLRCWLEINLSYLKNNIESIRNIISDKLDNRKITISSATNEGYRNAIENIYNSKIKANEIIGTVKNKFLECLNFQSNGYFETQKELDEIICENDGNIIEDYYGLFKLSKIELQEMINMKI